MKQSFPVLLTFAVALSAQTPAPSGTPASADPNRVVVVVEGRKFTADDIDRLTAALGGNILANYKSNPKGFMETFGLLLKLEAMAEQDKMPEADPHKWRLLYNRALYLAQSRMNEQNTRFSILPEEQKKYYDERKLEFASAKIRVIYLAFNQERDTFAAEKLAADIVKQARAGTDFKELVSKYSDDADSKAKGGEFPPVKPDDNTLPPAIKSAVFALKNGQISDPIQQPTGFWIFRMEEYLTPTYEQVRDQIYSRIMDAKMKTWMEGIRDSVKVEFKDPAFFEAKPKVSSAPNPSAPAIPTLATPAPKK